MFDIPNKDGQWVFTSPSTWQTWVKPAQYSNFIIYICGGGGGGAYGFGSSSGNYRGGGGGGGGANLLTLNSPSYLLPETLFINVGKGGTGVSTGTFGGTGGITYLSYYPSTTTANTLAFANGGVGGGYTGNQPAGGVGGALSMNQSIFSLGGNNGSAGTSAGLVSPTSTNANGTDFSVTTSCIYGGTGGAGINANNITCYGGNILASNIHPQLDGGEAGGGNGKSGYFIKKPFTALGGTGGGSSNTGKGGDGGDGIMGSGGGGGAGGNSSNAKGGNGGNGFVIIIGY
jgi:hypothetical protein